MNWLWYTIGGTFFVISVITVLLTVVIFKRRNNSNGSWSRENDREEEYYKKSLKTFCCTSQVTFEDSVEKSKVNNKPQIELKQSESFRKTNSNLDDFSESLIGTIDRLLIQQQQIKANTLSKESNTSNNAPCTSASILNDIDYSKSHNITEDASYNNKLAPQLPLSIIKNDFDYKKNHPDF